MSYGLEAYFVRVKMKMDDIKHLFDLWLTLVVFSDPDSKFILETS